jgi:hypothetical protein
MLVAYPFISKSSKVAKVTVDGGGRPLCSVPYSHILSRLASLSVGEVLAAAIVSLLDDDDAASLYFARRCVFRLSDGVFFSYLIKSASFLLAQYAGCD